MSKIEDALKKARMQKKTELVTNSSELIDYQNSDIALMEDDNVFNRDELSNQKILHHDMLNSNILTEFRSLRTTLLQKSKGTAISVMIYSSIPGAGSSYVAINLAAAIALDENRTSLILGCDFKNKAKYENLIKSADYGLVDYLSTNINAEKIIYPVGIKRVRIIPVGTPKETFGEYFSLRRFNELFDEIKKRYNDRYVIIDAPSALDAADIKILSEFVDYNLLIVPFGKDNVGNINKALRLVNDDKLLGIVINNKPCILS